MSFGCKLGLALTLLLQLAFGALSFGQFAPVADGVFYHELATRLASGLGYTVAWPDGVVTYAAHFPVGYPWLLSLLYRVFGANPGCSWLLAACLHFAATCAWIALSPKRARALVSFAYGLHPALFFYTPALMTEGITTSLWGLCFWAALRADRSGSFRARLLSGVLLALAVLVRPQSLWLGAGLFALGWASRARMPAAKRAVWALVPLCTALLLCAPWVARNCVRMQRCALAMNDGWNLLIGTQTQSGGWEPLQVPERCAEVFDEAGKDQCFGQVARENWQRDPWAQLARAPAKLRMTFDYFGAAPYALHQGNARLVSADNKLQLAAIETGWQRLLWLLSPWALSLRVRRKARALCCAIAALASVCALWPHAVALSAALLALLSLSSFRAVALRGKWVQAACGGLIASTLLVHALVFGAGRYGLVLAAPCAYFASDAISYALRLWRHRRWRSRVAARTAAS